MNSFDELVIERKRWLNDVLKPWCLQARRAELLKAEQEWLDIAGKVPVDKTLWVWAWSRFPVLVHESLGIEETREVRIELRDKSQIVGFPDSRESRGGNLFLWGRQSLQESPAQQGPDSIDDILSVQSINGNT